MNRQAMIQRGLAHRGPWDMIVIGGGASGAGVAVDAASRGYDVLLVERHDFGKGTSSRSTKLVHGGVRYLEQGNISLVMEALRERGILRDNAPHLVHELPFVVPSFAWWESPFYGLGLKVYNLMSGKYSFGPSHRLSREETLKRLPTLNPEGLRGGVMYHDGQFDDARMLINLIATAAEQGATVVNYVSAIGLTRDSDDFVNGVVLRDEESGQQVTAQACVVINCGGPFSDAVRRLADAKIKPMIAPSQGVHLVFDRSFLPSDTAIMVPHTSDKRVMFAIPWHDHVVVGTTDVPLKETSEEPIATDAEITFILETAGRYLAKMPTRADILSVFAGIRPLVKAGDGTNTAALSRDHTIQIDDSGLVTLTGGKWTTYRNMAEDCVNQAATLGRLEEKPCVTKTLHLHGYHASAEKFGALSHYGADAPAILDLARAQPDLDRQLHEALPIRAVEVVWAARHEMARTVEDVLARRTRALFLNARAALAMAEPVARLMASEFKRDDAWVSAQLADFDKVAQGYIPRV